MKTVISLADFNQKKDGLERVVLLMYKPENESSQCAFHNLKEASSGNVSTSVFVADVSHVRDIHPAFQITSVPSVLLFEKGKLASVIKGCQESTFLKALMSNELIRTGSGNEEKKAKQVTVYSTPTCSWCNTLKSWLKQNNISYRDVDISRDEKAAQNLVRRSGQQGVPQTDVNGQIVVGFNQPRLKELLEIQ